MNDSASDNGTLPTPASAVGSPPPYTPAPYAGAAPVNMSHHMTHAPVNGPPTTATENHFRLPPNVACPGNYTARAKTWGFRPTQGGDVMLAVLFEIKTGVDGHGNAVWHDFPRPKNLAFTDKSEERSFESLKYMGWNGNDIMDLAKNGGGINQEVDVTIQMSGEWEDTKGKKRPPSPEIAWINPISGIRGEEIATPILASWAAKMNEKRKAKLSAGTPSEAVKKLLEKEGTSVPGGKEDEIPF